MEVIQLRSQSFRGCNKASSRQTSRIRIRSLRAVRASALPAPQRSIVILPGLGNSAGDYDSFRSLLQTKYNVHVEVANVARIDWARNAAGLLDGAYWTGNLQPRPTVDWYLTRISTAVESARAATDGAPITLLAHSAGGWLGRLYMLDFGTKDIDQFVSLGSPHLPPPDGVIDQTRGILRYIEAHCPGCHHASEGVQYTTIAGKYIRGAPLSGPGSWQQRIVGAGYQQVCGEALVWGDGVVPVPAAHLDGALNITLEGVYHSPLGAISDDEIRTLNGATDNVGLRAETVVPTSDDESPPENEAEGMRWAQREAGRSQPGSNGGNDSGFDSDEFELTPGEVAEAAQGMDVPGPRVWYGNEAVLDKWWGYCESSSGQSGSETIILI